MPEQLPSAVERRIDKYKPTRHHVIEALAPGDLDRLRAAVRDVGPTTPDMASRLLSHGANHLAWARRNLRRSEDPFSPAAVEASTAVARASGRNASPFVADLRRLARAAAPRSGHTTVQRIAQPPRLAPYTAKEAQALMAIARGMAEKEGWSLRCGLALGLGAGLVGAAANAIERADIVRVEGATLVWAEPSGRYIPITPPWGQVLFEAAARQGVGPVTTMYTSDGRQRLERRRREATGCPELSSHRLRATWIVDLLRRGVPVDILSAVAGILPVTLYEYLPHVPDRGDVPDAWLAGSESLRPPVALVAAMSQLPPRAALPARGGVERGLPLATEIAERFLPERDEVRVAWSGALGAEVRARVLELTNDPGRAQDLLAAVSVLATWATTIVGLPLTRSALLRTTTIERWAAAARNQLDESSIATIRSRLRALVVAPEAPRATKAWMGVLGYSADELARLEVARASLDETDRSVFDAHWLLELGAGATKDEALATSSSHVAWRDGLVQVRLGGRTVALDHHYANELVTFAARRSELATLAGGGQSRSDRVRDRIGVASGVRFDPARLRASWLARRLADGVPLDVLTDAAGTYISKLNELCRALPGRSMAEQLAWHVHLLEIEPPMR